MKRAFVKRLFLCLFLIAIPVSGVTALDLSDAVKKSEGEFKKQREQANDTWRKKREQAARSAPSMDKSKQVCWQITHNKDAREACLGNAYVTENKNARNVILGLCYVFEGANRAALTQICAYGKQGCFSLGDREDLNACVSCNGDRQWLATWAAGERLFCYRR